MALSEKSGSAICYFYFLLSRKDLFINAYPINHNSYQLDLVPKMHRSLSQSAYRANALRVISKNSAHNFCIFPVIMNITNWCKDHITAQNSSLFISHFTKCKSIFIIARRTNLYPTANIYTFRTSSRATCLSIAGNNQWNFTVLLHNMILLLNIGTTR